MSGVSEAARVHRPKYRGERLRQRASAERTGGNRGVLVPSEARKGSPEGAEPWPVDCGESCGPLFRLR